MQDNLREELIKQFPAEVVELVEQARGDIEREQVCRLQSGIELGSHPAGRDGEGCEDGNLKI